MFITNLQILIMSDGWEIKFKLLQDSFLSLTRLNFTIIKKSRYKTKQENAPYLDTLIESLGQNVDRWVTFESIGQEIIYGYGDKNYPPSRFDYPQSTSHIFTAAGNIMKTHKFIYDKFKNAGIENVGIGIEGLEYSQPADNENQKGIGLNNRNSNFQGSD